ncbi:MAG: SpoIIE family protein phosphatase [Selenomonadales bacterium]|nr:SpoIIE family protein phosphatase [Selenomonadales bacterium]
MKLTADVAAARGSKHKEELCGDVFQLVRSPGKITAILSDGLGSGVKANIMATLTTKIACGLLERDVPIDHVVSTIVDTLPSCSERGLAYATFSILQIRADGNAQLYEYDSPPALFFRDDCLVPIERHTRVICGKKITEASLQVEKNDVALLVTDGVLHAGVGQSLDLGLGLEGLLGFLPTPCTSWPTPEALVDFVMHVTNSCYCSRLGDDSTAVGLRVRSPRSVAVFTGPPLERVNDEAMVRALLDERNSTKIVCGGTSAKIVERVTGGRLETSLEYVDPRIPPIAHLEGLDLVTEGVLTLNRCYELLRALQDGEELPRSTDAATLLARHLSSAEEVLFLVGKSFNLAHANIEEIMQLAPRQYAVSRLASLLRRRSIETEVRYF